MSRHVLIQGKGPDGKRTSVSIHSSLYQIVCDLAGRRVAWPPVNDLIRRYIAQGMDSWEVTAELLREIDDEL